MERFELEKNCRNTQKIHAEVIKSYSEPSECVAIGPEGRNPVVVSVANEKAERAAVEDALRKLVKQESVPVSAIVLLTPKAREKSKWREGDKIGGYPVSWLIPCPEGALACATIHAFKGLESAVVILTEMAERDVKRLRQLLYVGCSRAKSHLVVLKSVVTGIKSCRSLPASTGPSTPTP